MSITSFTGSTTYNRLDNSNLVEDNDCRYEKHCSIRRMPDPAQIYPDIFHRTSLEKTWRNSFFTVPNVRDGDGRVVMPYEYRSQLKDGSVVMLNVYLKVYVFFFGIKICFFLTWFEM